MARIRGFSLIELMIVVAIIAALASIAMPIYLAYIGRTQAAVGLADISIGKAGYESLVAGDRGNLEYSAEGIGIHASTMRCSNIMVLPPMSGGTNQAIACTLNGGAGVQGGTIRLDRDSNGRWQCRGDINVRYLPTGCEPG